MFNKKNMFNKMVVYAVLLLVSLFIFVASLIHVCLHPGTPRYVFLLIPSLTGIIYSIIFGGQVIDKSNAFVKLMTSVETISHTTRFYYTCLFVFGKGLPDDAPISLYARQCDLSGVILQCEHTGRFYKYYTDKDSMKLGHNSDISVDMAFRWLQSYLKTNMIVIPFSPITKSENYRAYRISRVRIKNKTTTVVKIASTAFSDNIYG